MADLLLGQVLSFTDDPFHAGTGAARHESAGAVLVEGGKVRAVGPAAALRAAHPQAKITDYGRDLISAGFVDAHVHYPQTAIIASWGKRLIDWLNLYTFPEEMRFADAAYADEIAGRYLGLALAHGTTSVCTYSTIHPESVDAIFGAAAARGMRIWAGAASGRTVVAGHPGLGPRAAGRSSGRQYRAGDGGRSGGDQPRLDPGHRTGGPPGRRYLASAVPDHHDG